MVDFAPKWARDAATEGIVLAKEAAVRDKEAIFLLQQILHELKALNGGTP